MSHNEFFMSHKSLVVNNIQLHVVEARGHEVSPDAPLALLLHGFPEYWESWRKQLPALIAAGYRVWMPDLRGYNLSDSPPRISDYRLKTLGADIKGLVEAAGVKQCVLIAHDWGAAVAWWAAAEWPELFSKLVIANVPHPTVFKRTLLTSIKQLISSWYIGFFQLPFLPEWLLSRNNFQPMIDTLVKTANPNSFTKSDLESYRDSWRKSGLKPMISYYRAALLYEDKPRKGKIKVPTLILWGKQDQALTYPMAQKSIELCDEGTLHYFEEATHWVHHDVPEAFNEKMMAFIGPAI